jgi:hypothetical protein
MFPGSFWSLIKTGGNLRLAQFPGGKIFPPEGAQNFLAPINVFSDTHTDTDTFFIASKGLS